MRHYRLVMTKILQSLCLTLCLAVTTYPALAADWEGVFEGTLGKAPIIVELNAGQGASSYKGGYSEGSRYSYLPAAYDLKLVLKSEGKTLEFLEGTQPHYELKDLAKDDPAWTGHWSLKVAGKTASGTWVSRDGKKSLPIALKRLPLLNDVGADFNQLSVTYNNIWFGHEKISGVAKPVRFGEVELAFEKDSAFNLPMPVFTAFPDKAAMARANSLLREYYKGSLISNRDCVNGLTSEPPKPYAPEYNFEVIYASSRVVTISEGGSVFCGGAHPNNYVSYLSFDLVNGQQIGGRYQLDLSPQGFGTVLKLDTKDERIAFENFALARWQEAAKAGGETDEDGCGGVNFMGEQEPGEKEFSLLFNPKGLGVQRTDYPSAAANCLFQDYNPTVIPWADVKPFLRNDQTLLTTELK
jgi:hypothetical protein